jgi:methylamine utilization protein MauJ
MLAFTTGSRFQWHRIRQIVDAIAGTPMRSVMMWSDSIEYEDPRPFLDQNIACSIERLSEFDIPPAIQRAMRWYRLGVNSRVPDDQFTNFWFALEILAEFQKSQEKVSDACPKCRSPLYCETCKTHPTHKPYAKQAIRALLKAVDKDCDGATIDRLDKTRNSLMHGSTLKEIENSLPQPHEQIVDVLGRLLWKARVHQLPREMFDGTLSLGVPSTYVHRTMHAVAHVQTVVPTDGDGDVDLNFKGTTAALVPFDPPQSARPFIIRMNAEQYKQLGKLGYAKGDHADMCLRVYQKAKEKDGHIHALVLATDMALITDALKRNEAGTWQDLFREIMGKANGT